jgi:hypothetical protein
MAHSQFDIFGHQWLASAALLLTSAPLVWIPSRKRTAGRNLGTCVSPYYDSFEPRNITGHLDHWIRPLLLESDSANQILVSWLVGTRYFTSYVSSVWNRPGFGSKTSRDPGSDGFNIEFEISRVCIRHFTFEVFSFRVTISPFSFNCQLKLGIACLKSG